jgi:predicted secreted protein
VLSSSALTVAGLLTSIAVALGATAGPSPDAGPGSGPGSGPAAGAAAGPLVQPVAAKYPTNAAKIFRWGSAVWKDEFVRPLSTTTWRVNQPSLVRDQHGMLTLDSTPTSGDVVALANGGGHRYGRWEARVRTRSYKGTGTPYRAVWELAPTSGGEHCGARGIELSDYAIGAPSATMHVRNTPDADFTASRSLPLANTFHTYAVEVTPDHVSWFVDTKVVMTERRPAALSGAVYTPRFRLVSTPGATMRKGRMQMDWVRYYTLARKSALPITAPQAVQTTYAGAC